jgi:hypothetical protein
MAMPKMIGELLVEKKHITPEQLDEALAVQKRPGERRRLGEILVARGYVRQAQIQVALANQKGVG